MSDRQDQYLDDLLSRHLQGCLDGQLGRSLEAFAKSQAPSRWRWKLGAGAGMAAAAGVALALVMFWPKPIPSTPPVVIKPSETPVPMVQTTTWSGMTDAGTVVVDDHPVRQMRRKVVDQVEWYDANHGAMVRTTRPRQQIFLIGLETN